MHDAAYYNENDPFAAQWLRNLIARGLIAPGDVDDRSIVDVRPDDVRAYRQCHFFAGIGVWSYALRRAGWHDDRAVWTGSCPCQPFSGARKQGGVHDQRHLWPEFFRLIRECRPGLVLGEQVASRDGLGWFDIVQSDMEGEGYPCAALDLCAAGVGAPHIRQRLFWVANARDEGWQGRLSRRPDQEWQTVDGRSGRDGTARELADPVGESGRPGLRDCRSGEERGLQPADGRGIGDNRRSGPVNGHWRDADWLLCRDGQWRAVEAGTFPLAHGAASRVGRLRGYGNAIVAPLAAEFIKAVMDAIP